MLLEGGNIINTSVKIKLDLIRAPKIKKYLTNLHISNPYIGTLDLETYDQGSIPKVYSRGFYTKKFWAKIFKIDPLSLDSQKIVAECIDSMLLSKFINSTFYVHNLGSFDIAFFY